MASKQKQIISTLVKFYQRPVAQVSLELFLSISTVIFFGLFAVKPTLLTMSDLIKEIDDKKQLEQQLSQKIASLSTVQNEFVNIQKDLSLLDQAIPSSPDLINTLKIIENIASTQEIAINQLSLIEIPKKTSSNISFNKLTSKQMQFKISVVGDYLSIKEFVEALKKSRRVFFVEDINFRIEEKRGVKNLSATVGVSAPFYTDGS